MLQKRMALPLMLAMALFLGAWATPGSAQTLDELKAQVQEMSKRLQELEAKQEQLEQKTDATAPDSQTVTSGTKGVKLTTPARSTAAFCMSTRATAAISSTSTTTTPRPGCASSVAGS